MKTYIYMISLLFFSFENQAQSIESLAVQKWEEDIDYLQKKLFETFPEADKKINKSIFLLKKNELKAKLPDLSMEEIVLGMQSLLALANDEGCYIYPFQSALNFQVLPLKNYWFKDGMYVCDATDSYHELIGQKIIKVNGIKIEDIFYKLKSVLPADNEYYQRHLFPMYFQIPAWLNWAGVLEESNSVVISTASGMEMDVPFVDIQAYVSLNRTLASQNKITGSNKDHSGENYWMEYLPDAQTLFVQFLQITDIDKGESFNAFVRAIEKELKSGKTKKLIIDNRYGGGGNGFKLKPLTDLIRDSEIINQKGKLFIFTSRSTRGTILEMTSVLMHNTKAILVGEPTGEGPNMVGDTKNVTLPNSKIQVSLSHTFWQTSFELDPRTTIVPSQNVEYSYTDYTKGRDPWLTSVGNIANADVQGEPIPEEIANSLIGKHTISGRTLVVIEENGRVYLTMNRKIKSFFELKLELFFLEPGVLSTDISGVQLFYKKDGNVKSSIVKIEWFGEMLE
jgi:hypothetical protein